MTKIAINTCFGAFHLSDLAIQKLHEKGILDIFAWGWGLDRTDTRLIQVIEELGEGASRLGADIRVIEIPDDVKDWYIHEYDGLEWICEGRTWGKRE